MNLDEIIETILDIANQETKWKEEIKSRLESDNYHSKVESTILNIEGVIRERLKTSLNGSVISNELYQRLTTIPEDITNLEDAIKFLADFYFKNVEMTKAQQILTEEHDCEMVKKCATCFFGKYRADKNVWRCIKHDESNFSTHVCPDWKNHKTG